MLNELFIPSLITNRDDVPAYWQGDMLWLMLATGAQTNGQYSLIEQICRQGSGPGPHQHTQHEALYFIEGEADVQVGDQSTPAKAGSFVFIPRHTTHSFRVISPTVRLINCYSPAGFEEFVIHSALPALERTLPPPGQAGNPNVDRDQVKRLAAQCGMSILESKK